MAHFLLSMVLISLAVVVHRRAGEGDRAPRPTVGVSLRRLAHAVLAMTAVALVLGTVVTGSGPHSGDILAGRTGFDPALVSRLHADAVIVLVVLTVALLVLLRRRGAPPAVRRATGVLLAVELGQGAIGYVQYFTDLPVLLVGLHLVGACLVLIAAVRVVLATRDRGPAAGAPTADRVRELTHAPA
jgi:cytochrome c oxidase assembly protein subunit 15